VLQVNLVNIGIALEHQEKSGKSIGFCEAKFDPRKSEALINYLVQINNLQSFIPL